MKSITKHWDSIFFGAKDSKLGWYEQDFTQTFKLLNLIPNWENSTIFLPGVGTSNIIEEFIKSNVKLILNDISIEALQKVRDRLKGNSENIKWLPQNIAKRFTEKIDDIDVWIDRAVLHFLTEKNSIKGYFENVKSALKPNGYVIFAEFSKGGATKCAGLSIHRYSVEEITERLGPSFNLIAYFNYTDTTPSGEPRPYIYTLYKRHK